MRPLNEFPNLRQAVDEVLGGLGFVPDGQAGRWRSDRDGRSWTARLSRDQRTKYAGEVRYRRTLGYRLRIDVTTSVKARLYLVKQGFTTSGLIRRIYRWRRLEVLPRGLPGLPEFVPVTRNPDWARRLLADPVASQAAAALSEYRAEAGAAASVYFEPGTLYYASPRLQPQDATVERLTWTVERLSELVRAAERLPAPERPAALNRVEVFAKANPALAAVGCLFAFGAISTVGILLMLATTWLLLG